jgi:hypothetical protein
MMKKRLAILHFHVSFLASLYVWNTGASMKQALLLVPLALWFGANAKLTAFIALLVMCWFAVV